MPTDENLAIRGFLLPSMCSLCCKNLESTSHLFLQCPFALSLWNWFSSVINLNVNLNSIVDVLNLVSRGWSPQCQITILAAIVSIFNNIWLCRNSVRFKNIKPSLRNSISLITSNTSIAGNFTSQASGHSMIDFAILKFFKININHPKAPNIVEVIWTPPLSGWVKCNTDGSSLGNPGIAASDGIFRNHNGASLGCFAYNVGTATAFFAEFMGIILAVECAFERSWMHLWIESDSHLAILAFKNPKLIPWQLHNRWSNCLLKLSVMEVMVSHVYREGNSVADKLSKLGVHVTNFTWWNTSPSSIWDDIARNRDGLPFYRFC
jgi:ribonuclease HI